MTYLPNGDIQYRKVLTAGGQKHRMSVCAKTPTMALKLMREKEKRVEAVLAPPQEKSLSEAIYDWLVTYRRTAIKPKSYDRIEITFHNQLEPYLVARMPYQAVTAADIQRHLNGLVEERLSWSTIKKAYDLLNGFYKFEYDHKNIPFNIMVDVSMPAKDYFVYEEREIQYLKKNQVPIFTEECYRLCKGQNKLLHQSGPLFVFIIYTGLRVGELLALRWRDINFRTNTMTIRKSVEEIFNREYDESAPEQMKQLGITKRIQKEGTTKNKSTRVIALNNNALNALSTIKRYSAFTAPNDYVAATKYGKCNNEHNLYRRLTDVLKRCDLPITQAGCHMLRHTCASLLFEAGLQVEIIASILGHSPEVCRKTYIHFCQQQQAAAIHKIAEFNI